MPIYLYSLRTGKLAVAESEQFGDVHSGNVPNDFKIDATVIVRDKVSHSLDLMPLNVVLCLAAVFLRQPADQLADLQNIQDLKSVAACYGYTGEMIDRLLRHGFTTDEIEELLYESEM